MLKKAKEILASTGSSCVLIGADGQVFKATGKGIMPLLGITSSCRDRLAGCFVADRIIGKGAAILLCDVGASEVFAEVMSESALKLLRSYNVKASWGELVPVIINRTGDGSCPLERAVADTVTLEQGRAAVYEFAASLAK